MKVVGQVNSISRDLLPQRLKPGQVVRYQLLTGSVNPDPEERSKRPVIYPMCNTLPALDRIYDEKKSDYVDIALVESYDKDKVIIPRQIVIWGRSTNGQFHVTGGNISDEELHEYLEITNYNDSNPRRDKSKEPLFKRIDDERDSKDRSKKRSSLKEALTYAMNLTNGEVKDFAASMGWDENVSPDVLRDKIEAFAQNTPDAFIKTVESKDREVKVVIKRSIDAGKISYNGQEHKIVVADTNQTLIKMDRAEGVDYLTQAAEYILHNKNGQKVFDTIKRLSSATE